MKFLTKEIKIALATIAALVLLFIGINFLKGINVFVSSNSYYVKCKDIAGLTISNAVYANGYPVGIVRDIDYDYAKGENVVVQIELDDEMRVPEGTKAEIENSLMGGVSMVLRLGPNPTKHIAPKDTIPGAMAEGALDKMSAMVPTVVNIMPKLDSIMSNLNRITADPALMQTIQNAAEITSELRTTTAALNKMMAGDVPQLVGRLNRVSADVEKMTGQLAATDLEATMQNINSTLANAKQLTDNMTQMTDQLNHKMNSKDNTLGLILGDRQLYDHLTSTVSHADSLMIDLKAHPKRYVHFSVFGRKDK